jgi:hypothetical protein
MVKHRRPRPYDSSRLGNPEMARIRKERYLRRQFLAVLMPTGVSALRYTTGV